MPNKKGSASPVRKAGAHTSTGRAVAASLKEAVAHVRGEISLPARIYAAPVDVKAIRKKTGLSQSQFAQRYGFSLRTLQDWERGRVVPPSAVRSYLIVIERSPDFVAETLRAAG